VVPSSYGIAIANMTNMLVSTSESQSERGQLKILHLLYCKIKIDRAMKKFKKKLLELISKARAVQPYQLMQAYLTLV
jgi:hypothetical protein